MKTIFQYSRTELVYLQQNFQGILNATEKPQMPRGRQRASVLRKLALITQNSLQQQYNQRPRNWTVRTLRRRPDRPDEPHVITYPAAGNSVLSGRGHYSTGLHSGG